MNDSNLNDLIGSRICHDLVSPLGAIGNGVELLTMSTAAAAPELAMISESIENANARIRFFRVAFGAASAATSMGNSEVRSILSSMYRGSRLKIDWRIDTDLPRSEVKLAFLLLQCLESALPWGGTLRIMRDGTGIWTLRASSERQKIDPDLWDLISNPNSDTRVTPPEVHFALVRPTAMRAQRRVMVQNSGTTITISF